MEVSTIIDSPKLLGDVAALATRLSQIHDPHLAPLTYFVQHLRERMGPGSTIPYFDPWDGGVDAQVMLLLEAPGPKARNSGFVSMNNPDETAKNIFTISREAGMDRKRIIVWNTVPWYIGTGSKIRPASKDDIAAGVESLADLIALLPKLRAVVLVGGKAQKAERHLRSIAPDIAVFTSPHPSPLFINRKPENREVLLKSWQAVNTFLAAD